MTIKLTKSELAILRQHRNNIDASGMVIKTVCDVIIERATGESDGHWDLDYINGTLVKQEEK